MQRSHCFFLLFLSKVAIVYVKQVRVLIVASSLRDSVIVLACEHSSSKGRPDGGSEQLLLEQFLVADLQLIAIEEVVLGLFDDWLDEVVLITNVVGLCDFVLVPFTCAPIKDPSLADQPVVGSADLLHRGLGIGPMAEDNIDIVKGQSVQRVPDSFDEMLAGEALGVGSVVLLAEEYLGGEHEVMPWNVEAAKGNADLPLGLSIT